MLVFNDATTFGDYFHGRIAKGLRDLREAFLIKRAESYECVCPRLRVAPRGIISRSRLLLMCARE